MTIMEGGEISILSPTNPIVVAFLVSFYSRRYDFRDWLSPASKSWYDWNIAKKDVNPQNKEATNQ